jgi:hypothetical protein
MALESIQPITEMSTSNLSQGKGRLARKPDNLTTICEPRRLITLWASTNDAFNELSEHKDLPQWQGNLSNFAYISLW